MLVQQASQMDEQSPGFVMNAEDTSVIPDTEEPVEATAETQAEAPVESPKPEEDNFQMSKRLRQLQHKEAQLQKRMNELSEAKKQIEEFNSFKNQARSNPLRVLESLGITYEELTDFVANGYEPNPETKYQELEAKFEARFREREEQEARRRDLEVENQVKKYKDSLYAHIQAKSDEYELINLEGEHETVWELMDEWYTKHNEILDWDQAAQMVEEHLEEQLKTKLSRARKLQNLVGQTQTATQSGRAATSTPKTISSSSMSSGSSSPNKRALSDEESLELAASLIKWE